VVCPNPFLAEVCRQAKTAQEAALRESIGAPAQHSRPAASKTQSKLTAEDQPVHSFAALIKDLATLSRNQVRPKGVGSDAAEFTLKSQPTAIQQRALQLLPRNL
jgi:hypothetical protein